MPTPLWTRERLAWVAGIIEGEGCFTIASSKGKKYPSIVVAMTDRDVLDRLMDWTGLGSIYGPYLPSSGRNIKPLYRWTVNGGRQVYALTIAILPWLCERRRTRALELVQLFLSSAPLNVTKTHCNHGHPFSEQNTYREGNKRRCRTCRRLTQQTLRDRRRNHADTP